MKISRQENQWVAMGMGPIAEIVVEAASLREARRLWFAVYIDQVRDNRDKLATKGSRRSVWV